MPLEEAAGIHLHRAEELLALDEVLKALEAFDLRKSRITELRFFGGLTVEETAKVMGLSPVTVICEINYVGLSQAPSRCAIGHH